MKLEFSINRTDLTFGADPIPTTAADLLGTNVFHAPQYGVDSEPMESIAVAFSAPAGAGSATLDTYLWDAHSDSWYQFASGEVIAPGEIRFIPLPNIIDRKDSRASSKVAVAVVATPGATPAGNYVLNLSSATSSPTSAGIEPPLEIEGATAEGDVPVSNPLDLGAVVLNVDPAPPYIDGELRRLRLDDLGRLIVSDPSSSSQIEGMTAVGDVPVSNPLDIGAVVLNADPAPYTDLDIQRLRLDSLGRLIVTDPSSSPQVEGIDADDDPATANPVGVGGIYLADPAANTLEDGDIGRVLVNDQRMLVVEIAGSGGGALEVQDLAYDPVTDANKVVPVVQTFDNHEPFDQSQAAATAAVVTHYVDARTFPFWSMLWSTLTGGGVTIGITIGASNETTEPDLTLRSYTDITNDLYGGAIGLTSASAIALAVDTPLLYDSYRIQYTPSGLATWTAEGKKGSY